MAWLGHFAGSQSSSRHRSSAEEIVRLQLLVLTLFENYRFLNFSVEKFQWVKFKDYLNGPAHEWKAQSSYILLPCPTAR
jgi:hypothetical protein